MKNNMNYCFWFYDKHSSQRKRAFILKECLNGELYYMRRSWALEGIEFATDCPWMLRLRPQKKQGRNLFVLT